MPNVKVVALKEYSDGSFSDEFEFISDGNTEFEIRDSFNGSGDAATIARIEAREMAGEQNTERSEWKTTSIKTVRYLHIIEPIKAKIRL
ncbi:hypothetical protein [Yersinia bercovieri]|uniref:Uncharacterized protein n=1 Tax=Yersinia bercovieri TaxID=634 RepID=A0A2G4TXQ7_YERBE|nr:hypothetical protein [Yersinia bercovieri]PHZ25792.1 hypothetical protein CS533_19635 [Yersinia bercovieri]CNI19305.1 Uncharacterised protein [Yersinia bercovieri]HEN3607559.1 hypothetical protein [Yersinia enterocolitica]